MTMRDTASQLMADILEKCLAVSPNHFRSTALLQCDHCRLHSQGFYAWTLTTTVVSDYTQTPRLLANNAMQVRRQLKVTDNSRD